MRWMALMIATAVLCSTGCGSDDARIETGTATLEWQIAARDCAAAGVEEISVSIQGDWTNEAGQSEWRFPCADRRGTVPMLRPGRYVFDLHGLYADGDSAFDGVSAEVEVRSRGEAKPGTVVLRAREAVLTVEWTFGGPFCSHLGIRSVEVLAFDRYGSAILEEATACEVGSKTLHLRPGDYDVALFAYDDRDRIRFQSILEMELDRGAEVRRKVVLGSVDD